MSKKVFTAEGRRYAAFISYSHADEKVAAWLHKRLEAYRIPKEAQVGPSNRRLGRVFRDRVDLKASSDLGKEIRAALDLSDALILICSPRSAKSRYVEEEICHFKATGKGESVFAVIADGEPYAANDPGRHAEEECFPRALLYRVDADGQLSDKPEASETLAADFRTGKDGRESGLLKIIAGLLNLDPDTLVQRERRAERRRRFRANAIAAAMAVLAIGAGVAGAIAMWQRAEADRQRLAQIEARFRAELRQADLLSEQGTEAAWQLVRESTDRLVADLGKKRAIGLLGVEELEIGLRSLLNVRAHIVEDVGAGRALAFTGDGKVLLAQKADGVVAIDVRSGKPTEELQVGRVVAAWPAAGSFAILVACSYPACSTMTERELAGTLAQKGGAAPLTLVAVSSGGTKITSIAEDCRSCLDELGALHGTDSQILTAMAKGKAAIPYNLIPSPIDGGNWTRSIRFPQQVINRDDLLDIARLPTDASGKLVFDPATSNEGPLNEVWVSTKANVGVMAGYNEGFISIWRELGTKTNADDLSLCRHPTNDRCVSGLAGAKVLDLSSNGRLVLVANVTQGTGGGVGVQETALIDTETGQTVWRAPAVSHGGAISPDGETFFTVDWRGRGTLRRVEDFAVLFEWTGAPGFTFYDRSETHFSPTGRVLALSEPGAPLQLIDTRPRPNLAMDISPLQSQRSSCRNEVEGPFRAVGVVESEVAGSDWSITQSVRSQLLIDSVERPHPVSLSENNEIFVGSNKQLIIEDALSVVGENWLQSIETGSVLATVSPEANGMALLRPLEEDASFGPWTWLALRQQGDEWLQLASANRVQVERRVQQLLTWSSSHFVGLQEAKINAGGETYRSACTLVTYDTSTGNQIFSVQPGFSAEIEVLVSDVDNLLVAVSHEWYGAISIDLFDLRTGASGPWLLVEHDDEKSREALAQGHILPPPWGDQLRQAMLGEVDPAEAAKPIPSVSVN